MNFEIKEKKRKKNEAKGKVNATMRHNIKIAQYKND